MSGCGAVVGGVSLENVDISTQAVIQGIVSKDGQPASVGYVRLHDKSDEFVAEVPISKQGEFRFFTVAGDWTVVGSTVYIFGDVTDSGDTFKLFYHY